MDRLLERINTGITFLFYSIFFLVPLIMHPSTYELFEFNKMWFLWGAAIIIFFLWTVRIIIEKRLVIQRTPLDIPILLFLGAHVLSTLFSIDHHVSWWGYYSRFNGGLLSMLTYIFLYYAFASNVLKRDGYDIERVTKFIFVWIASGIVVSLWGFPSHFGKDLTCYVFRGELSDVCWTYAFQPQVRMFSTLGQPNWFAAFLLVIIPSTIGLFLTLFKPNDSQKEIPSLIQKNSIAFKLLFGFGIALMYICLIWSNSRSGFIGFWIGMTLAGLLFILLPIVRRKKTLAQVFKTKSFQMFGIVSIGIILLTFSLGHHITEFKKYSFVGMIEKSKQAKTPAPAPISTTPEATEAPTGAPFGGSDSGRIRKFVWRGAIDIFKTHPLFGTGPETFAYAYYKVKPAEHNLTTEWDYLYNKAHNEFLNYLATTGILGFGSYMAIIILFYVLAFKSFMKKTQRYSYIAVGFIGAFTGLHISNFFGFSVVIGNLFFFFIPLLFFVYQDMLKDKKWTWEFGKTQTIKFSGGQLFILLLSAALALYCEYFLARSWYADIKYALGYNLNRAGDYTNAFAPLQKSVELRSGEPTFKDEYSINLATLSLLYATQNQIPQAQQLAATAKALSDENVLKYPNNVVFHKSRTRVLYSISEIDHAYLDAAISSLQKGIELAPTDAKNVLNMGLFLAQKGDMPGAIASLNKARELRPNYRDAYYYLGSFYKFLSEQEGTTDVQKKEYKDKAIKELEFTLKNIAGGKEDPQSQELLNSLTGNKNVTTEK